MREGMSAAGSKVGTRSPDTSAHLDLMESLCPRSADAHEEKLRASNGGVHERKTGADGLYSTWTCWAWWPSGGQQFIQMNILPH